MTFREPGFSPAPGEPRSPEQGRSLELKRVIRKWLTRLALVATPLAGDHSELRSVRSTRDSAPVPSEVKAMFSQEFAAPAAQDSIVVFAHPEPEHHVDNGDMDQMDSAKQAVEMFVASSDRSTTLHVHHHGDHVDDGLDHDLPSSTSDKEESDQHPHSLRDRAHHHEGASHTDHEKRGHHSVREHDHEHGASHFEIFQGGVLTNEMGAAMTEVLDLHGHVEIPMLTEQGTVVVGLEKQSAVTSGEEDQHAEVLLKPNAPLFGSLDMGAGMEFGVEGSQYKLSLSAPMNEQVELWGGLRGGSEHEHHGEAENIFSSIQDHLDVGWTMKGGAASVTAGIRDGEPLGKLAFELPLQDGQVLQAQALLTAGSEHPGVFLKISSTF